MLLSQLYLSSFVQPRFDGKLYVQTVIKVIKEYKRFKN